MILRATWYQQVPSTTEISFWRGGKLDTGVGLSTAKHLSKVYTPFEKRPIVTPLEIIPILNTEIGKEK